MTNFERLLDLPLREVLKEFDCEDLSVECAVEMFSFIMVCPEHSTSPDVKACKLCEDVLGSCASFCRAWFEAEASPDANYNEDRCFEFKTNPPHSDKIEDYLVIIDGLQFWNIAQLYGDKFLDVDGNILNVTHYRPIPKLPDEIMYEDRRTQ